MAAFPFSSVYCSVQPEELTLLLIKLRRQQAELNSLREHTVAQLMALGMEGPNAKVSTECVQHVCLHARICAFPTKQSKLHILCVNVYSPGGVLCITLLQMKLLLVCSETFYELKTVHSLCLTFGSVVKKFC